MKIGQVWIRVRSRASSYGASPQICTRPLSLIESDSEFKTEPCRSRSMYAADELGRCQQPFEAAIHVGSCDSTPHTYVLSCLREEHCTSRKSHIHQENRGIWNHIPRQMFRDTSREDTRIQDRRACSGMIALQRRSRKEWSWTSWVECVMTRALVFEYPRAWPDCTIFVVVNWFHEKQKNQNQKLNTREQPRKQHSLLVKLRWLTKTRASSIPVSAWNEKKTGCLVSLKK